MAPDSRQARGDEVIRLIRRGRLGLSSEKHPQENLAALMTATGIAFEREKRLSATDIQDFLVDGGVVLECKMRNKSRQPQIGQRKQGHELP